MNVDTVIAIFLQYKYPALVVLALVEGPYVMMLSGFLLKLGTVALIPTFIALSIGDLIADVVWYYVGHYFGNGFVRRFGRFFDITPESIERAKQLFGAHRKKILLGSKLTAGFGLSLGTLITAGMVGVPFWEYITLNFFGQLGWTAIMIAVGYFFGNFYIVINNVLGRVFIVAVAVFALFLLLRFARRLGRRAEKNLSE